MIKLHKGFTLVEIILVLAIISLTAGLVIYTLNPGGIFQQTNSVRVESDKLDLETAFIEYKIKNEGDNPFEGNMIKGVYYRICKQEVNDCDIENFEISLNGLVDDSFIQRIPFHPEDGTDRYTGFLIKDVDGAVYNVISQSEMFSSPENAIVGTCFDFQSSEYCVVSGTNGTMWLDRNLGASQAAESAADTSAFGDLYQWGRSADGHQNRQSPNAEGPSNQLVPGGNFLTKITPEFNWYNGTNKDGLWQGVTGVNNPCPTTWRIPTLEELHAEMQSWASDDAAGAFASGLKITPTGRRGQNGTITENGTIGYYWTSKATENADTSYYARIDSFSAITGSGNRVQGMAVRCIKDFTQTENTAETAVYNLQKDSFEECSGFVDVNGDYYQGDALGTSNTVVLSVFVASVGDYSIETNTVNGYKFFKNGTFNMTGNTTVTLGNDEGIPQNTGVNQFTASGGGTNCTFDVTVE